MAKRNKKKDFASEDKGFSSSLAGAFAGLGLQNIPTPAPKKEAPPEENVWKKAGHIPKIYQTNSLANR